MLAAHFAPRLLAKGSQARVGPAAARDQKRRSGLPKGFRHELISLTLMRRGAVDDDLTMHLVASHHGRCRPFAPVVGDPAEVEWNGWKLSREEAAATAAHRLDGGVPERFWALTRRYGWWGLAYLEALLRLGDWTASEEEVL